MRLSDRCNFPCATTPECLAFEIGETVETPFTGSWTRHRIVERFRSKHGQSGVVYRVDPPVHPNIGSAKMDAAWFRKPQESTS